MRILAFLFLSHPFLSCQQVQENVLPLEAGIVSQAACQSPAKARPSAANIIFQSSDGGLTWQDVSNGLPKDLGIGRVLVDGGEVFLTSESGLYRGSTASAAPNWAKEFSLNERITNIFPGSTGPYASSYDRGFFQEMPGTGIWKPMHNTLKDKTVRAVLEAPDGAIFVGCETGIYKSTDGGSTWKHVFSEGMANSFAASGNVLICGSFKGMLRSTDGGEHWDWVLIEDGGAYNTKLIDGRFVTLMDGDVPWNEVVTEGLRNKMYTSADLGKTWQRMDEGLGQSRLIYEMNGSLPPAQHINDIQQAGGYLFCSLDTGIFRSSDWGKNWELVRPSNGKTSINLAASGNVIFAVIVYGC